MTTVFPAAVDSFSLKVDNVTNVMAADVNNLQDSIVAIQTALIALSPNPNLLYHTLSHDIWPEGVTFNDVADDSYVAGLWNTLWSGNAPDVSGEATVIAGSKRAIKCLFDTNGSQAGFVQFLSNEDTVPLRGKILSFSIDAAGFNVVNMRCAILEWTGTADAVTSDVVATWAVGNPTLATNWAFLGAAAASQALSGTTRIEAEGRTVGASANNLAVFVWTPDSEDSTDYVRLANAKLEIGLTATSFVTKEFTDEQKRVNHFIERVASEDDALTYFGSGLCYSTTQALIPIRWMTIKRIAPIVTSSAANTFSAQLANASVAACTVIALQRPTKFNVGEVAVTVASGLVAGNATNLISNSVTTAYIQADARL